MSEKRRAPKSKQVDIHEAGHPWADFMDARLRLIHMWHIDEGRTPENITADLNHHDPGQIRLLLQQEPDNAVPASTREKLFRAKVAFELLGLAKRYGDGDCTREEMYCKVTELVERLP